MVDIAALSASVKADGVDEFLSSLKGIAKEAGSAEKATDRLAPATAKAGRSAKGAAVDLLSLEGAARALSSSLVTATLKLAGMAAAALSVRAIARMADSWSDMRSVLGAATGDMAGANDMMARMVEIANASYAPLQQTVETYSRNVRVMQELGYTAQQTADFTEALNHALVITATKGQDAAVVQSALSRAMAVGKLTGDQLESVISRGGRVAQALAKELGITVNGLRDMAAQGKITSEVIANALIGNLEAMRAEAERMPPTMADGFERIRTGLTALVGNMDQASGASLAFANALVAIGDGLKTLALTDLSGYLRAATIAAEGFAVVIGALAIGRIAASMTALSGSINLVTIAYNAGAMAGRAFGLVMAAAGGPVGLGIAAVTTVAGLLLLWDRNATPLPGTIGHVTAAQKDLNAALAEFSETESYASLTSAAAAAQRTVDALRERYHAMLETEEQLMRQMLADGYSEDIFNSVVAQRERAQAAVLAQLREAEAVAADLHQRVEEIGGALGYTADQISRMTDEQLKALQTADQMLATYQQRAEIARLENLYGEESLQVMAAQLAAQRDTMLVKVAALEVDQRIRDAIIAAYDAAAQNENMTRAWGIAAGILSGKLDDARAGLAALARTEPGAGWLDAAIAKAARLAGVLWDAASAARTAAALGQRGNMTYGTPLTLPTNEAGLPSPGALLPPRVAAALGTGGGGGGGGGATDPRLADAERWLDRIKTSTERLADEQRELNDLYQEGYFGPTGSIEAMTTLERGMQTLAEQYDPLTRATQEWASSLQEGILDAIMNGKNLTDVMLDVAKAIGRAALEAALFGSGPLGGGGKGLLSGIISAILPSADGNVFSGGRVVPFARGGIVNRPTLFPMARGAGLMGEAGPEAIMPLKRGADGKLGVAGGGSANVVVNNYSGEPASAKRQQGPDGEELVIVTVGKAMGDGRLDAPMGGRFGSRPVKVRR